MIKKETQEIQCDHCKSILPLTTNLKNGAHEIIF